MGRRKLPFETPPAPPHLSEKAQKLWSNIIPRRAVSPERITLLQVALEALDRCDEARRLIEAEGLTTETKTTGARHVHPALTIEKEARAAFMRVGRARLALNNAPTG